MSFTFRDAKRADVSLLILLAGGTASGKTESAMRLATGLAGGQPFAVIDTENGRALHKADDYKFQHTELDEPFTPERYAEAVKAADDAGFPVIVIDSGSHEYEGVGGVLDLQAAEFERMGSKESARMASWIKPKQRHKRFVQQLLRVRAHVILCLRAEDKIEIVKQGGKTVVQPKTSLIGADGWIPICEKRLPFEATISLLLLQSNPGVPVPIKLERRHEPLVSLDARLDEQTGVRLAEWARGGSLSEPPAPGNSEGLGGSENEIATLTARLTAALEAVDRGDQVERIALNRGDHSDADHLAWLERQIRVVEESSSSLNPQMTGGQDDAEPSDEPPSSAPLPSDSQTSLPLPAAVRERMGR